MFEGVTHIFQIPLRWFKAVDAKCFKMTAGHLVNISENAEGGDVVGVDAEAFSGAVQEAMGDVGGEPVERTDAGADDDEAGEAWTWTAGGESGLVLDCYCKVVEEDGLHMLCRARLTFSKSGLLVKAEGLKGRREIQG